MARVKSSLVTGLSEVMGSDEFVIVELTKDGPKPVYDARGQLLKFSSGELASAEARAMTSSGSKFQPRRVKDDTWREREVARFVSKEYKSLPWDGAVWWKNHKHIWGDHYPHVSQKNSVGLMAFTESDDKGSADLQTPIKPGKYLERYFSGVLDTYIMRDLCTTFSNVFEDNCLLFADSEAEFESLYTTGPSSCMSHPPEKFTSHIHPVRVYAAGDLALVYMKRDGRIVARALCWPEKKTYSRVYGDAGRIEPLLGKEGYKKSAPFGARLQRVFAWENKKVQSGNRGFVVPHIDDCTFVMDNDDHLLIGGGDTKLPGRIIKLVGAQGVSEWVSMRCKCGKETTKSDLKVVYTDRDGGSERWCSECVKTGAFTCKVTGSLVRKDQAVTMFNGDQWWSRTFADQGFVCAGSGLNYPSVQAMTVRLRGKSVNVAKSWYKDQKGAACKICGVSSVGDCETACKTRHEKAKATSAMQGSAANLLPGSYYNSLSSVQSTAAVDWTVAAAPRRR